MTCFHAVLWVDHQTAQLLQFDAEHVEIDKLHAQTHHTRQHGSGVRTEHVYFGEVCDALDGIAEVLVVGPRQALADFRHFVDKHRPQLTPHLVAYEPHERTSDKQLVAMARHYFVGHDRMSGLPTPG